MSQGAVEIVRKAFEAWNRRDLTVALATLDQDVVIQEHPDFSPNPGTYRGLAEAATYMETYDRAWEDWRITVDELRSVNEAVIAFIRFSARGRASGVPIETPVVLVGRTAGNKFIRIDCHLQEAAALEAVGLSE